MLENIGALIVEDLQFLHGENSGQGLPLADSVSNCVLQLICAREM